MSNLQSAKLRERKKSSHEKMLSYLIESIEIVSTNEVCLSCSRNSPVLYQLITRKVGTPERFIYFCHTCVCSDDILGDLLESEMV